MNLQETLDTKLQQRQARETGICPVRRQLYTQCFDELIRQVSHNLILGFESPDVLLMKVFEK